MFDLFRDQEKRKRRYKRKYIKEKLLGCRKYIQQKEGQ